ncbi:MAG: thioredoxin family protein [Candidatus Riflebacteria bacterium]|nr:thioredoxin family protein [Candidatus Riflebacteria bacterium]
MLVLTSEEQFQRIFIDEKPSAAAIVFLAEWCAPSRRQKPVMEAIADEYAGRAVLASIDVDALESLADRLEIRTLPCLVLFANGEQVEMLAGYQQDGYIRDFLDAMIAAGEAQKPQLP